MKGTNQYANYKSTITQMVPAIGSSGDPLEVFEIAVTNLPTFTKGWVIIESVDLIYFHEILNGKLRYYRKNRDLLNLGYKDQKHQRNSRIQEGAIQNWMQFLAKNLDDFGSTEYPYGAANIVKVSGGKVVRLGSVASVSDTNLTLSDGTKYIVYAFADNVIKSVDTVDPMNHYHIATAVVSSGTITSITDVRGLLLGTAILPPLTSYASNAAAITGGLVVGQLYRDSNGFVKQVI